MLGFLVLRLDNQPAGLCAFALGRRIYAVDFDISPKDAAFHIQAWEFAGSEDR